MIAGYAVGIHSPISKVWMILYSNAHFDWSIRDKEPHNTLVNTVMFIGAVLGAFTAFIYVRPLTPGQKEQASRNIRFQSVLCSGQLSH